MTPHTPSPAEPDGPLPDHPDVDVLADLAEGLADPAREPVLRAHLAGCPECADTFAALAEVRDLLGSFELPTVPEDVARRLDTALAAAADAPRPATVPSDTVRPPRARTGAPDAVRPSTGPNGGTGPGRSPRRRRRRALLAAATAVVALGLGALLLPGSPERHSGTAASAAKAPAGPGAVEYRDDRITAQAQELVRAAGAATADQPHSVTQQQPVRPRTGTASGATGTATAPACAAGTTGVTDRSPLAVGPGSYRGTAALALVYPVTGRPDELDVYLITPDCGAPGVLLHRTVPAS